jgi:hypothetical protein
MDSMSLPVTVTTNKAVAAPTRCRVKVTTVVMHVERRHPSADKKNKRRQAEELVEKKPMQKNLKPNSNTQNVPANKWFVSATSYSAFPDVVNKGRESGNQKALELVAA